jgi:iron complex transport system substrate-binding protein
MQLITNPTIGGSRPRSPRGRARRVAGLPSLVVGFVTLSVALAGCGSGGSGAGGSSASGAAAASTAATSSSATPPAQFPTTVEATNGTVTIPAKPARIVSLSPTATEDLYAVGAGNQVVAVDSLSNYPAGAPVTALSAFTPNVEAISEYRPDLVIASADSKGLVAGMTRLSIPILVEPAAATLDDAYSQISQIGQATGHTADAAKVVSTMRSEIAADVARAKSTHPGLTYYWELSAHPYYSVTSTTFIGQVAGLFGLKSIADKASHASDGGYPMLTDEYILTAQPLLIFLADSDATAGGQSPAVVAERPGWSVIPAVANKHVVALNADIASRWGPRLTDLVARIADSVQSEATP